MQQIRLVDLLTILIPFFSILYLSDLVKYLTKKYFKKILALFVLIVFVSLAYGDMSIDLINLPDYYIGGNPNTVVAVVDSGIFFQDFWEYSILDGYDFVCSDNVPEDTSGHGTAISEIILTVAPDVTILPVKVLNSDGIGSSENIAKGIEYSVASGAKVINLSLAFPFGVIPYDVEAQIKFAYQNGCILVSASGNDYSSSLPFPASSLMTISVGAIKNDLRRLEMSNYGPMLDLVAPGDKVLDMHTGTSFACPFVTGTVAIFCSEKIWLNSEEIKWILWESSSNLCKDDSLNEYGSGLLNVSRGLYFINNNLYPSLELIDFQEKNNTMCFIGVIDD